MEYNKILYRLNNKGQPTIWWAVTNGTSNIIVTHGILGKTITNEVIYTGRLPIDEVKSRIAAKRKSGYKYLYELKDNTILPVEELHVIDYVKQYMETDRTTANGVALPMLAKVYDLSNPILYHKVPSWIGQYKINGLRCRIGAKRNHGDLFRPIVLTFHSREGNPWDSLYNLEKYLLNVIPDELINLMLDENYILDGELYIPGETVNNINSYVKNVNTEGNNKIQFWCYDLAIDEMSQHKRITTLHYYCRESIKHINNLLGHLNNTHKFVVLPFVFIDSHSCATEIRDAFIALGFEGLILRDPVKEYQFGKRNSTMLKYKATTDGKFTILNIKPEGDARPNIPLLTLKNDINDATFDVHITGSFLYQKSILDHKDRFIGRVVFVTFGERSGIKSVPFHVKEVILLKE